MCGPVYCISIIDSENQQNDGRCLNSGHHLAHCFLKEALIKSDESGCRAIFRRGEAQKRRNTVCISSFCNEASAKKRRQTPKADLISVSYTVCFIDLIRLGTIRFCHTAKSTKSSSRSQWFLHGRC